MKTIIKGGTLITMKDGEEPYVGDLLIENGRIAAIGESIGVSVGGSTGVAVDADVDAGCGSDGSGDTGIETIDARGMAVMPGLVNAHQHSPMSLLRGFSDDLKLMEWLERKMLPAEANMNEDDMYWGAKLAMAEMIRSGTTAFADMYIGMNAVATAVSETGMRASLARGLIFTQDDGGKRMIEALDLIDRWDGAADGRITTMLGPHSPFLCPPEPLREVIGYARSRDIAIHIHLAETREEAAIVRERYGRTPTEYLADAGLFDGVHALLAHAVHLNAQDIALLAGMKGGIAHNPVSNAMLGCGIAPVAACLRQGIAVGLGTDGAGSAATLDLLAAAGAAAWLQKLGSGDPTALTAREALRLATIGSARLLRLDREIGTLEAGKKADLMLVDLKKPHLQPVHNIESLLAYSATGADVDTVLVDGNPLLRNGKLLAIDEEELYAEAGARAARIVKDV